MDHICIGIVVEEGSNLGSMTCETTTTPRCFGQIPRTVALSPEDEQCLKICASSGARYGDVGRQPFARRRHLFHDRPKGRAKLTS